MRAIQFDKWSALRGQNRAEGVPNIRRLQEIQAHSHPPGAEADLDIEGGGRLISDVAQAMMDYTGSEFLPGHESTLALLTERSFDLWCYPSERTICLTRGFIDAVEFIGCNYMLFTAAKRIQAHSALHERSQRNDLTIFRRLLLSLQTAQLTLHITGERPLPPILHHLPPALRRSATAAVDLTIAYALMHEQAHIEAHRFPQLLEEWRATVPAPDLQGLTPEKVEEHFADCWALEQVPAFRRAEFFKPVLLFFANHWLVDLLFHTATGTHPHTLERVARLASRDLGADGDAIRLLASSFVITHASFYRTIDAMPIEERQMGHIERCRQIVEADGGTTYANTVLSVCEDYAVRFETGTNHSECEDSPGEADAPKTGPI